MKGSDSRRAQARLKERRSSPRLKVNPLVYLKMDPDNGGFLFDLGEGGMGVRVANPLVKNAQIRFSFLLEEQHTVQGSCRICWLSETGRSAGVRFVSFPEDSRRYIRQWLRAAGDQAQSDEAPQTPAEVIPETTGQPGTVAVAGPEQPVAEARSAKAETGQPAAQTSLHPQNEEGKTPSSFSIFAPPPARPDPMAAESSAAEPSLPENDPHPPSTDSLLFFFPGKKGQEDEADSSEPIGTFQNMYRPGERPTFDRDSEETAALQSAILSGSPPEEDDKRKKSGGKKLWVGAALCAALVGVAVLTYSSPRVVQNFHGVVSTLEARYLPQFTAGQKPAPRLGRKIRRTSGRRAFRHRRGNRTFRSTSAFHDPGPGETSVTGGTSRLSIQGSPAMPGGQSLAFGQSAGTLENTRRVFVTHQNDPFPPKITVSMTASAPNVQLGEMTADLRNDGALVEEAAPISLPLDLDHQAAVPKQIVVEAVIGEDGAVKNVRLISSPDSRLAQAVVAAVKQWRYRPLHANGQPAEFTTRITFDFSASQTKP